VPSTDSSQITYLGGWTVLTKVSRSQQPILWYTSITCSLCTFRTLKLRHACAVCAALSDSHKRRGPTCRLSSQIGGFQSGIRAEIQFLSPNHRPLEQTRQLFTSAFFPFPPPTLPPDPKLSLSFLHQNISSHCTVHLADSLSSRSQSSFQATPNLF